MAVNKWRLFIIASVVLAAGLGLGGALYWKQRRSREAGRLKADLAALVNAKNYDAARLLADRLGRAAPQDAEAQLLRAAAYLAGRDPGALASADPNGRPAIQALLTAVKIGSQAPEPNRLVIAYYIGQREFAEARPFAENIVKALPDDPEANLLLARLLAGDAASGAAAEARRRLKIALAQEPAPWRPRAAIAAALVSDALGKDGGEQRSAAEDWLARQAEGPRPAAIQDRLALVEIRAWRAQRSNAAPIVSEQLGAALRELEALGADPAGNDRLPGFVLDFAQRLVPVAASADRALDAAYGQLRGEAERVIAATFRTAVDRKTPDPNVYTTYAERLRATGQDAEAARIVEQGVANAENGSAHVKSEFGAGRLWLAKHYLGNGQAQAAGPHVAALLADDRWRPWGQLMEGYSLWMAGEFAGAAKPLEECLRSAALKDNGAAHALYGLCMLRGGHPSLGRQHLERGKALGADSPQLRAWLALALAQAGDGQKAMELARQLAQPSNPAESRTIGDALLGELLLAAGNLDEADKRLDAALSAIDPKLRAPALLAKAQVRLQRGDGAGAQQLIDEVKRSVAPEAARAFALEAKRWRQAGDEAQALAAVDEGRKRFPDDDQLLALRIDAFGRARDFAAAERLLRPEAERRKSAYPLALLADVQEAAGKADDALATLAEARRRFPKDGPLGIRLAERLLLRGRSREAGPLLAELEGDPAVNPTELRFLKARLETAAGHADRANEIISTARAENPDDPQFKLIDAQRLAREGKFPDAAAELEKVLASAQQFRGPAATMLFEAYLCDGQTRKAADLLRRAERMGLDAQAKPLRRQLLRLLAQRNLRTELDGELTSLLASGPDDRDVALAVSLYQNTGRSAEAERVLGVALGKHGPTPALAEIQCALLVDRGQTDALEARTSELFRDAGLRKNATLHALRVRGLLVRNEPDAALKAAEAGLGPDCCPGNPGLVALKAQLLMRAGRDAEAASFVAEARQANAEIPAAPYVLARAAEAVGKGDRAFALLAQALKEDPSDANAAHHYVRMLLARGQYGDLEPTIEKYIEANAAKNRQGESPLLLGVLGEYHATRGNLPMAIETLKRLEKAPRAGVVVPYLRGAIAFASNDLKVAEQALQVAMADASGHLPATFLLAQIRAQQGRTAEALQLLDGVAANPESPVAVPLMRASLLAQQGDAAGAESACRDYLQAHPAARPFRQLLARLLAQRGTPEARREALALADAAVKEGLENPLDFEVFLGVLFAAGQKDQALKAIADQAVRRDQPDLLLAGGRACYGAGLYRDAEQTARRLVEEQPENVNARLLLGDALLHLGQEAPAGQAKERQRNFEAAADQYRTALKQRPKGGYAMIAANNLAWTSGVHLGEPARALDELAALMPERLAATNSALPPEILDTVGYLQLRAGRLTEAQTWLEAAAARQPANAEPKLHLAETFLKQDRKDLARRKLEEARAADRAGRFAKEAAELAARL